MKIRFEFVGGPNDGKRLEGVLGQPSDAERFYLFANRGTPGQRFRVASDYAVDTLTAERLKVEKRHSFQSHFYVVAERLERDDNVCVRAEYIPQSTGTSSD